MATCHFPPRQTQPRTLPPSNIFPFWWSNFFTSTKNCSGNGRWNRTKFSKECLTLCQFFLFSILNFRILSTPDKIRINSYYYYYFFFSSRKKTPILKKKQIRCCSWLLFSRWMEKYYVFVCFLFFLNHLSRMGLIFKERE